MKPSPETLSPPKQELADKPRYSGQITSDLGELPARLTPRGALQNLQQLGLEPLMLIDVGGAYGGFTHQFLDIFGQMPALVVEPLVEYQEPLDGLVRKHQKVKLVMKAAADSTGPKTINVHRDLVGSSLLIEWEEPSQVNGEPRQVEATTLDKEIAALGADWPRSGFFLKVDVQGAELAVLDGAQKVLQNCLGVLLETTFFPTFEGGPLFSEVVAYMAERGFLPYDLTGFLFRPLDGALMQIDVLFVPADSPLRRFSFYATPEQRAQQDQLFRPQLQKD